MVRRKAQNHDPQMMGTGQGSLHPFADSAAGSHGHPEKYSVASYRGSVVDLPLAPSKDSAYGHPCLGVDSVPPSIQGLSPPPLGSVEVSSFDYPNEEEYELF